MNRLRQARTYLSFTIDEVAAYMGCLPEWVERAEAADVGMQDRDWERLSKLLRRPVEWLQGAPVQPVENSPELRDMMQGKLLSPNDRGEPVDFAQFLKHRLQTRH